jgi:hypothetical protein
MRDVGKSADLLKSICRGSLKRELHETMILLIDTIYLHLTYESIDIALWENSKLNVLQIIEKTRHITVT